MDKSLAASGWVARLWSTLDQLRRNPITECQVSQDNNEKALERNTFVLLAVFLAPILAIAIVGGYGFAVWISQLLTGPPGTGV